MSVIAPIDLTTALPPSPPEFDTELRRVLGGFADQFQFGALLRKNRVGGSVRDREAGALWLASRLGSGLDIDRLVVTNGTQSALNLLLQAHVGSGGVLAAEALTYVVLQTIARRLGIQVVGVPLDEEGVDPGAFDALCRRAKPKALYCNPTVHNPTAAVMSESRRREVVEVARKHGVMLIEDDVLGAIHPEAPPPIAAIAPDITWYVMSLSKCYAMGVRLAYLVAPDAAACKQLVDPVSRLSSWFPSSLGAEIATCWARDGGGKRIAAAIRAEADARHAIAADILPRDSMRTAPGALHIWLRVAPYYSPQSFAEATKQRGVLVRPADLFAIDEAAVRDHVRVSVTGPDSRDELQRGLRIIAKLLAR